ncbi:MAG: RimK domain-containing protein ATP-grasp [Stygiobacter sp.]|nr:MAG: RimK domain-containing protein ATP-grasp [Stygiobacter sp.]KAF0213913.1 MAG: RimK domain-containing protein [Ignavibacteria bacterium]
MQKQILIITNKTDFTADFLIKRLYKRGIKFIRINTEDFPQKIHGTISINNNYNEIMLRSDSWEIIPDSINGIWYRRPLKPSISNIAKRDQVFIERESSEFLLNTWHLLYDKRWVNNPTSLIRAERKLVQLKIAADIGFTIPNTLVSNRYEDINSFINDNDHDIIVKPISHGDYDDGEYAIFTNSLTNKSYPVNRVSAELAPFIAQNRIDKIADIRVNVFGDTIFAFILQAKDEGKVLDWRKLDPNDIKYQLVEPPSEIANKIKKMVQKLSLNFCVFDFALSQTGEWVFLEINPNGQWAWLEQLTSIEMSDILIDLLLIAENKK